MVNKLWPSSRLEGRTSPGLDTRGRNDQSAKAFHRRQALHHLHAPGGRYLSARSRCPRQLNAPRVLTSEIEAASLGALNVERVDGLIYAVVMESRGIYMSSDIATA